MDHGRFLSQTDTYSVVLGSSAANGTFGKIIRTGSYIQLTNPYTGKSQQYVVVGVLKELNTSITSGNVNSAVYMTKAGLKGISDQDTYTSITVRADNVQNVDAVASNVQDALSRLHRNEAFSVTTQKAFSSMIQTVFSLITDVLAGIGAVSLVVGGIGIMNVMMLTVKERTKEIGLMKAIGATTTDVRLIFLTESALLGLHQRRDRRADIGCRCGHSGPVRRAPHGHVDAKHTPRDRLRLVHHFGVRRIPGKPGGHAGPDRGTKDRLVRHLFFKVI